MYGLERQRQSRVLDVISKGQTTAFVEPGLDWVTGDELYFAPTAQQANHSDYLTVHSYDYQTGELELTEPFQYYHWGGLHAPSAD
jgi:hypothetical protein